MPLYRRTRIGHDAPAQPLGILEVRGIVEVTSPALDGGIGHGALSLSPMTRRAGTTDGEASDALRLLGPVELRWGGEHIALGGPMQRAIVALLSIKRGSSVPIDSIVANIWGQSPPAQVRKSLSTQVARLRRALTDAGAPVRIEHTGTGYRLDGPPGWTDLEQFDDLLSTAEHLAGDGRLGPACIRLDTALALWRDRPMCDLRGVPFVTGVVPTLVQRHDRAEDTLVDLLVRQGRMNEAVERLQGMVVDQPYDEDRWQALVEALVVAGRRREAVEVCQQVRRRFAEVGLTTGAGLRDAEFAALADATDETDLQSQDGIGVSPERSAGMGASMRPQPLVASAAAVGAALAQRGRYEAAAETYLLAADRTSDESQAIGMLLEAARMLSAAGVEGSSVLLSQLRRRAIACGRWDLAADAVIAGAHIGASDSMEDALRRVDRVDEILEHLPAHDVKRFVELLAWSANLLVNVDDARAVRLIGRVERIAATSGRPELALRARAVRLRLREAHGDDPEACAADARRLTADATTHGAHRIAALARVAELTALLRDGQYASCAMEADALGGDSSDPERVAAGMEARAVGAAARIATVPLIEAEQEARRVAESLTNHGAQAGGLTFVLQQIVIRREQLRLRELEPLIRAYDGSGRRTLAGVMAATARLEAGDAATAADDIREVLDGSVTRLPVDWVFVATVAWGIDIVFDLATLHDLPVDDRGVQLLTDALMPYSGQAAVLASAVVTLGRIDRYLARLSALAGDVVPAVERCARTRELEEEAGSRLWSGWAAHDEAAIRRIGGLPTNGDASRHAAAAAEAVGSERLASAVTAISGRRLPS